MSRTSKKRLLWLSAAGAAALVAIAVIGIRVSSGSSQGKDTSRLPVFRLDADHATYPDLSGAVGGSETIIVGKVLSHSTEPGESPGVDALGDPLPAIPHTDYSVLVQTVLKGSASPGEVIVVPLSGGVTAAGEFVLDGASEINDGDISMFFLEEVGGKFYPLAGGAAVAKQNAGGSFVLPSDATGEESMAVTEEAVETALRPSSTPSQRAPSSGPSSSSAAASQPRVHCKAGHKKTVKGHVKCVKTKKHKKHKKNRQHAHTHHR